MVSTTIRPMDLMPLFSIFQRHDRRHLTTDIDAIQVQETAPDSELMELADNAINMAASDYDEDDQDA